MILEPSRILALLPKGLRTELLESYGQIVSNYVEHRWEPSELNGGKFCEVVYSILKGSTGGLFPSRAAKPRDIVKACRELENLPADAGRTGDRGVAHVGGDVNPNFLDATAVYAMASWTIAELVRIFHDVTVSEAQEMVDALIERKHLLVWEIGGVRRILDPTMKKGDQTLLLLYSLPSWVNEADLFKWVEYSDSNMFRKHILRRFHKSRWLEYDEKLSRVHISPAGVRQVEDSILADQRAAVA